MSQDKNEGNESIFELLERLSDDVWDGGEPGEPEALAQLESEFGLSLPEDYRQLLLFSEGGSLEGPTAGINLEDFSGLYERNDMDYGLRQYLPTMFFIGDDNGGSAFFYDPADELDHGAYALYLVSMGAVANKYAQYVAPNITQLFQRIVAGDDLFDAD